MTNNLSSPIARSRPLPSATEPEVPARDAALDLTRASITLLVIAHHAVLAYHRYAPPAGPFTRENMIWGAFPVVDAVRAPVVDGFTLWNDSFFMAMMFLLAGLFVPASLARKGAGRFVRDRMLRLGVPFAVCAAVLGPLAYLPAYLLRAEAMGNPGFWPAWRALGVWPAGPAWFLWVLLAFSIVAALTWKVAPRAQEKFSAFGAWCRARPTRACVVLGLAAVVAYLPTLKWVDAFAWATWGPFTVQTGRIALYGVYFLFGCALGASGRGLSGTWMADSGPLAQRWKTWASVAGGVFVAFTAALITFFIGMGKGQPQPLMAFATTVLFAVTGVTTTFAMLAGFARHGHRPGALTASLTRNAFGMYLVHYAIVTWLQFALLGIALPGIAKALLVTLLAIGASWVATLLLRRLPGVARIL